MAIIQVENLSKHFTYYEKELGFKNSFKNLINRKKLTKEAVSEISFAIDEGEMVGFLGPTGAGKTTTLKMLSGILFPTSGEAHVLGYVPWERKKGFKMNFSIVMGQKNQLWWDLPANESLYLNKCMYEIPDKAYFSFLEELAELLDVKDLLKVQVRRLSLGERMKMELIAALIHRPKVVLLDEPTIGLDLISQQKIRQFLKYYNQQTQTTVILTSHYLIDIQELCKRTIFINRGKIVFDGELNEVNNLFNTTKIIRLQFSEKVEAAELESFGELKEFDGFNATLAVDKLSVRSHSAALLEKLPVVDYNIEDVPLEEGIAVLYRKQ
ncbi:MAG TPA: ATP-binding cassette domain-containing protein [Bacillota bacterium]|nr:ATP-binding cassette domain-containing protein [Bacillota bacterium]